MEKTNRALTKQQQLFVDTYLTSPTMNATECVRIAYPKTKYPDKVASQLLGNTRVKKQIEDAQRKRAEKVNIDAEWVLNKYIGIIERCEVTEPQTARSALDSVGKHLGMFTDKVKLDVNGQVNHEHEYHIEQKITTDTETAELIRRIYKRQAISTTP